MEKGISLLGLSILIGLGWLFSEKKSKISWRTIGAALFLELAIAALIFLLPHSADLFLWANKAVLKLLSFAQQGALFVFGPLALSPGEKSAAGEISLGFILAFQIFPPLIFFSALMALCYQLGLIQPIVRGFSVVFYRLMGLSGAEALSASSNIFVGIEAVFPIRPFLKDLTRSELFLVLTACMASVASTTLAIYVSFLKNVLPTVAGHLISASLLSVPAAVIFSKLMIPETGKPLTLGKIPAESGKNHAHFMAAVIEGAWEGVKLAAGIASLLIAVLGLVAMFNFFLHSAGHFLPGQPELSLEKILGWVMIPFAWCLGITPQDIPAAAQILGERWILTEVVAYQDLARFAAEGLIHEPRTLVILSYALCGFAHVASVAIFVGGLSALIPSRQAEIAELGMRALIAAFLATLSTGCVAGLFFSTAHAHILALT